MHFIQGLNMMEGLAIGKPEQGLTTVLRGKINEQISAQRNRVVKKKPPGAVALVYFPKFSG